jgi:hypothetical protein
MLAPQALVLVNSFEEEAVSVAGVPPYVAVGAALMRFFWSFGAVRYATFGADDVALISGILGLSCVLGMCLIARTRSTND